MKARASLDNACAPVASPAAVLQAERMPQSVSNFSPAISEAERQPSSSSVAASGDVRIRPRPWKNWQLIVGGVFCRAPRHAMPLLPVLKVKTAAGLTRTPFGCCPRIRLRAGLTRRLHQNVSDQSRLVKVERHSLVVV